MSVVINTNSAATMAANNLAQSSSLLQKSLNRLSSGSKIVTPADDAGGLAVSMKLGATVRQQGAIQSNIGNANSFLQTQDGVLATVGKVLNRISELKTLALDPTKNTSDLANYNDEFVQLQAEITSLGNEKFNGISLFGTSGINLAVTADSTNPAVNVGAVALTGQSLSFTDNFADLSHWNQATSGGGTVTLGSGNVTLAATSGQTASITTVNSYSGPTTIQFTLNGGINFSVGGTSTDTVSTGSPQNFKIVLDGAGNRELYFNNTDLGSASGVPTSGAIQFAALSGAGSTAVISNFSITNSGTSGGSANVSAVTGASSLTTLNLSDVTGALQDVATYRATNGADQSRLGFATDVLTTNKANLEQANSRIVDVDVAQESTQLAKYNVLVQAGTAMLSQANQSSQVALKLLG